MEQSQIWRYFQQHAPGTFDNSTPRLDYVCRLLRRGSTILNVGIGGAILERLASARGMRVVTIDPDPPSLLRCAGHSSGVAGRIDALPFAPGSFDAVVASEVLEHLGDEVLRPGLGEIARVLRPGGRFIGTVPAEEPLEDGLTVCPDCGHRFHRWGHVQSFSARRLNELLSASFAVDRLTNYAFMAKPRSTAWTRALGAVRNALVQSGILTRERKWVFVAVAHPGRRAG
ncbi:MAG: class I SAM-dependent methyltransferase [Clostridia bacterium]